MRIDPHSTNYFKKSLAYQSYTIFQNLASLLHDWRLNNLTDLVDGKNLYNVKKTPGYLGIPTGDYFPGDDFSIEGGGFEFKTSKQITLLKLSGPDMKFDGVFLSFQENRLVWCIYDEYIPRCMKSKPLELNVWYHLAFVLEDSKGFIYVNGEKNAKKLMQTVKKTDKCTNQITNNTENISVKYIRLYKGSLSNSSVYEFYVSELSSKPSGKISFNFKINLKINPKIY